MKPPTRPDYPTTRASQNHHPRHPQKPQRPRAKSRIINGFQVETDGITVWVNADDGSTVARFGKAGIDIHTRMSEQLSGVGQCLFCTHTWTTIEDWHAFVTGMKTHYNLIIPDSYLPDRFRHR